MTAGKMTSAPAGSTAIESRENTNAQEEQPPLNHYA